MRPITWTNRALRRLEEIGDHIAASNPNAALRILTRIASRVETLAELPESVGIGRVRGTRELVLVDIPLYYCLSLSWRRHRNHPHPSRRSEMAARAIVAQLEKTGSTNGRPSGRARGRRRRSCSEMGLTARSRLPKADWRLHGKR
ncbi:type II toxin-antitoxin system RelE/ParE family toxin [Xaviernesmea oryzae]|uniref:type II toxin-antitoxin system RelE/ParE family toxin n=1 Tax=Xaviernesmea oryzae TaxID=464029 RepID=UPI002D21EB52|nr:type II toxin-antitoxin system RelE/ParE family toxin [Xaviernesmea oryzae]